MATESADFDEQLGALCDASFVIAEYVRGLLEEWHRSGRAGFVSTLGGREFNAAGHLLNDVADRADALRTLHHRLSGRHC